MGLRLISKQYLLSPLDVVSSVAPPVGTTAVWMAVVAGGGSGGGANFAASPDFSAGSGGGAGGKAVTWITALPPTPFGYLIGSGGAAAGSSANGLPGNPSYVRADNGVYLAYALGGAGGIFAAASYAGSQQGGLGGSGTTGDQLWRGCSGGPVTIDGTYVVGISGFGGSGPDGGGGGRALTSASGGLDGPSPGSGGGGALTYNSIGTYSGGKGGDGYVYLEWWG